MRFARSRVALLAATACIAAAGQAAAEAALQPYQMVRSLQLVQDRIAGGDHAAMPMQKKLLEMIDARLRTATRDELDEPPNFRAVLVYGMSGGNPATVESSIAVLALEGERKALALGVVNYLRGQPVAAQKALEATDPLAVPPELGAFLALIKGSMAADKDPASAVALLDRARLLGPGTLVEEAALRRSVGVAAALGDGVRFLRASSQYVRRFLHSPYASQFADSFVAGVLAFGGTLPMDQVDEITGWMSAEQRRVVYLRIARRAGIDGLKPLAAFAAEKALAHTTVGAADDPRALLYAALGTVASGTREEAFAALQRIDPRGLTRSDLELLDAVRAVAATLTADLPPAELERTAGAAGEDGSASPRKPAPPESAGAASSEATAADARLQAAGTPNDAAAPPAELAAAETPSSQASHDAGAAPAPPSPLVDPADAKVREARRKLDEVDKLLRETAE